MAEHKKNGACRRLIVTGCMAERYRDELRAEIPEIDAVLGTGEVPSIVGAIALTAGSASRNQNAGSASRNQNAGSASRNPAYTVPLLRSNGEVLSAASTLPTYIYDADTPRLLATPRHYAYVKIAEGCDYKCAFCIIPKLRGHYRSRPVESIVAEAESLATRGVKELLLISQDTSFYGNDRQERGSLARLLRALARVDGLEWVRMLYLYPTTIGDEVLEAMAESDKICKYVDLPLQHASDAVLKRMKRPGTRASYEKLLDRIRTTVPGVTLRTTFIVGFPGETETDFAELESFVQAVGFDHVGVFTYSHEEGTSAHQLVDDVSAATKRARQRSLMQLQKRIVRRAQKQRIGQTVRLVIDGPSAEHELVLRGRLEGQAPDIDPLVYLTDCDPGSFTPGEFIRAEVVGSRGYDLLARPTSPAETGHDKGSSLVAASSSA
jgi:ribosomal protein S12 methylthiotransferase